MASCQARILGEEYTIQGTNVKCHKSAECGAPSVKKITVDDGDAFFHICAPCFRRLLTKGSSKDTWLGWFDCAYPPHARVTYSAWYYEEVKKAWEKKKEEEQFEKELDELGISSASSSTVSEEEVEEIIEEIDKILEPTKKDILKQQITEIETWMRGEGRLKFKEQVKKTKELMNLRAELKLA
jgi:hypothetical protein